MKVASRQFLALHPGAMQISFPRNAGKRRRLRMILESLFGVDYMRAELDHDPPLAVRKKIRNKAGAVIGYSPDANDPNFLVYRSAPNHRLKTNVRGDGAQYPDRVRIKKIRRIERRAKPKRKYNWPKRKLRWWDDSQKRNPPPQPRTMSIPRRAHRHRSAHHADDQ